MAEYLTEIAYMRWLKQYSINIQMYFDAVDKARLKLAQYALYPEAEAIEDRIAEIEKKLEEAIPRNFNLGAQPLEGSQKFLENMKVLINIILHIFRKESRFSGIYQQEKTRILTIHHEFDFKTKLYEVEIMLENFERNIAPLSLHKDAIAAI